jgi:RNA polymerase nonessential primary-like sigma factor
LLELTPKQKTIVECRFGLNGREPMTLENISNSLGMTRERVRQIQAEALELLRRALRRKGVTREILD